MEIVEVRETSKDDRGIVYRKFDLKNQKNEVIQTGILPIMVKRRD